MSDTDDKNNNLNLNKIEKKIKKLRLQIIKWNTEYYINNNPSVSDNKYDIVYDNLTDLEKQFPQFVTEDSPTKTVGSKISTLFEKFEHETPMLSLEKATTKGEIIRFYNNIQKIAQVNKLEFSLEHKIDGVSISLHYDKGKLVKAVTRGDGKIGEDVTENIYQISSISKKISYLKKIEIRGEIFIEKKYLPIINEMLRLEFEEKQNEKNTQWNIADKDYEKYLENLKDWEKLNEKYLTEIEKYKTDFEEWKQNKKNAVFSKKQNFLFNQTEDSLDFAEPTKPIKPIKPKVVVKPKKISISTEFKPLSNVRNAASGSLRQKNSEIIKKRNLSALFYEIVDPLSHDIKTQGEAILFIEKLGLRTQKNFKIFDNIEEIFYQIDLFKDEKEKLDYDADGMVIKFNEFKYWKSLGTTSKFPKYAIAFKYPAKEFVSTILDITANVGRTGKITYVADIEPISISDTTIAKATLNNWNYIYSLRLNIGDKIKIIKSGEIIPKITALVEKQSSDVFRKFENCPGCKTKLGYIEGNVDQYCFNPNCDQKIINSLVYAVSREALNIRSLGKKNIETFYKKGYIKDISDIFELEKYKDEISTLPGFKEKRVNLIFDNINKAKKTKLERVIYSLGINEIGMRVSIELSKLMNNLDDFINYNLEDLNKVFNIGEAIVKSLKNYLSVQENVDKVKKLASVLYIEKNSIEIMSDLLIGLKFSITGIFSKPRSYFANLITENSGEVLSTLTKKTDYLLVGDSASSKLTKAHELNIKTFNEDEFYKWLSEKGVTIEN